MKESSYPNISLSRVSMNLSLEISPLSILKNCDTSEILATSYFLHSPSMDLTTTFIPLTPKSLSPTYYL